MDVVFVHGLTGDRFSTWRFAEGLSWLNWLAEDNTTINVYTAGYDSSFFASVLKGEGASLADRATTLIDGLLARPSPSKQVVLVAHSLGGLVVKQMLRDCQDSSNPKYEALLNSVSGVVFIATPHQGADLAKSLGAVLGMTASKSVKELKPGTELTINLSHWFRNWIAKSGARVLAYYETRRTNGIMLVAKATADPGVPGCDPVAVEADHISICRPANREAQLYCALRTTLQELGDINGKAKSAIPPTRAPAQVEEPPKDSDALAPDVLVAYEFYTASAPGDRRTLEEKLHAAGRAHEVASAKQKKEHFSMAIQRHIAQPSALEKLTRIMSDLETRFNRHARQSIANDESNQAVNAVVQQMVVDPVVKSQRDAGEPTTSLTIESALYYLTGNCHIEWDNV